MIRRKGDQIDWLDVHERVALATAAANAPLSAAAKQRILEHRANALAKRPFSEARDEVEVLSFSLGGQRFALAGAFVREVIRYVRPSRVPGASPFVLGVIGLRGDALALFDLHRLLGTPPPSFTASARIFVVGKEGAEFGFVVDEAFGVEQLDRATIRTLPSSSEHRTLLTGVTEDHVMLLDAEALLQDPRFVEGRGD